MPGVPDEVMDEAEAQRAGIYGRALEAFLDEFLKLPPERMRRLALKKREHRGVLEFNATGEGMVFKVSISVGKVLSPDELQRVRASQGWGELV